MTVVIQFSSGKKIEGPGTGVTEDGREKRIRPEFIGFFRGLKDGVEETVAAADGGFTILAGRPGEADTRSKLFVSVGRGRRRLSRS